MNEMNYGLLSRSEAEGLEPTTVIAYLIPAVFVGIIIFSEAKGLTFSCFFNYIKCFIRIGFPHL